MCNLYSMTKGQAAIREIAGAMTDKTGNLAALPAIFPDQSAPVVRQGADGRELTASCPLPASPSTVSRGTRAAHQSGSRGARTGR